MILRMADIVSLMFVPLLCYADIQYSGNVPTQYEDIVKQYLIDTGSKTDSNTWQEAIDIGARRALIDAVNTNTEIKKSITPSPDNIDDDFGE